jgi:hypothetical protein
MIDFKKMKPVPKMQDPIRYPNVIIPIENELKDNYTLELNKMLVDVTKKMVNFIK